jgi:hypothetical protein
MMAWKDQKRKLHFGVSDTGSWRSQESRLFITGVPKLRNAKRRNPETGTSTKTPFWSFADREIKGFGYRELEESRVETLHHRSPEVANSEILKQAHQQRLHFRVSQTGEIKGFRYRELEESRVETLHHRSPEVAKCETPKS